MIRKAIREDVEKIGAMGRRFFEHSANAKQMSYHQDSVEAMARAFIDDPRACVWIADGATAAVVLYPCLHNASHIKACGSWLWVEREKRGHLGSEMLHTMEAWAKEMGADSIDMAANAEIEPKLMARWYATKGYSELETVYTRTL